MAVTLEQTNILTSEFDLATAEFTRALLCMRRYKAYLIVFFIITFYFIDHVFSRFSVKVQEGKTR